MNFWRIRNLLNVYLRSFFTIILIISLSLVGLEAQYTNVHRRTDIAFNRIKNELSLEYPDDLDLQNYVMKRLRNNLNENVRYLEWFLENIDILKKNHILIHSRTTHLLKRANEWFPNTETFNKKFCIFLRTTRFEKNEKIRLLNYYLSKSNFIMLTRDVLQKFQQADPREFSSTVKVKISAELYRRGYRNQFVQVFVQRVNNRDIFALGEFIYDDNRFRSKISQMINGRNWNFVLLSLVICRFLFNIYISKFLWKLSTILNWKL